MSAPWSGTPVDAGVVDTAIATGQLLEWIGHTVIEAAPALDADDIIEASTLAVISTGAALARPPEPHGTLDYDDPEHTVRSWLSRIYEYGPFTAAFNISGNPAVSVPLGLSPPIGSSTPRPRPVHA